MENIQKINFTKKDNKITFTVTKEQLVKPRIQMHKQVSKAKPGETGGVFYQYTIYLKDYFKK